MSDDELLKAAEASLGHQGGKPTPGDLQRSIAASLLVIARNSVTKHEHTDLHGQRIVDEYARYRYKPNNTTI